MSVELMGVTNLDDFLDFDKESMADFVTTGAKENGDIVTIRLAALDIKKILRVQTWFVTNSQKRMKAGSQTLRGLGIYRPRVQVLVDHGLQLGLVFQVGDQQQTVLAANDHACARGVQQ